MIRQVNNDWTNEDARTLESKIQISLSVLNSQNIHSSVRYKIYFWPLIVLAQHSQKFEIQSGRYGYTWLLNRFQLRANDFFERMKLVTSTLLGNDTQICKFQRLKREKKKKKRKKEGANKKRKLVTNNK